MLSEYRERLLAALSHIDMEQVRQVGDLLLAARTARRLVLIIGNGGSAATASHFACDLQKMTLTATATPLQALCLADSMPLVTAWANDADFNVAFSAQVRMFADKASALVCISASGESINILDAAQAAQDRGLAVVGITSDKSALTRVANFTIAIPSQDTQIIEDCQMAICHMLARYVVERASAR